MADVQYINNNSYSWSSIILKIGGEVFHGFTSISYADKRERVKQYGMGRHHAPRARSAGKYTIEPVKLGGPKSTMQALRDQLAKLAPRGKSYGDVEIQIVVQYIESDEAPITVEIDRCVYVGTSTSEEENPDPLKEEVELDAMYIRRNQAALFNESAA